MSKETGKGEPIEWSKDKPKPPDRPTFQHVTAQTSMTPEIFAQVPPETDAKWRTPNSPLPFHKLSGHYAATRTGDGKPQGTNKETELSQDELFTLSDVLSEAAEGLGAATSKLKNGEKVVVPAGALHAAQISQKVFGSLEGVVIDRNRRRGVAEKTQSKFRWQLGDEKWEYS